MEGNETIQEVELILEKRSDNINAKRFLRSAAAKQAILDRHLIWNEDHRKMGKLDMVYDLETSVNYCIDVPESINRDLR